jgi:hypothetical protein
MFLEKQLYYHPVLQTVMTWWKRSLRNKLLPVIDEVPSITKISLPVLEFR